MRGKGTGLKPKPVHPCERHLAPRRRIHQFTMKSAEETCLMTRFAWRGGFQRNGSRSFLRNGSRGLLRNRSRNLLRNRNSSRCTGREDQYPYSKCKERQHAPPRKTCYAGTPHIIFPFDIIRYNLEIVRALIYFGTHSSWLQAPWHMIPAIA